MNLSILEIASVLQSPVRQDELKKKEKYLKLFETLHSLLEDEIFNDFYSYLNMTKSVYFKTSHNHPGDAKTSCYYLCRYLSCKWCLPSFKQKTELECMQQYLLQQILIWLLFFCKWHYKNLLKDKHYGKNSWQGHFLAMIKLQSHTLGIILDLKQCDKSTSLVIKS